MKQRALLQPGYKAQNGYTFTADDCKRYNSIQTEINSYIKSGVPLRDNILGHSCMMFKTITGIN